MWVELITCIFLYFRTVLFVCNWFISYLLCYTCAISDHDLSHTRASGRSFKKLCKSACVFVNIVTDLLSLFMSCCWFFEQSKCLHEKSFPLWICIIDIVEIPEVHHMYNWKQHVYVLKCGHCSAFMCNQAWHMVLIS